MIDDVFAQRVFGKFDQFDEKLDNTCHTISKIKTDVALLKNNFDNHIKIKNEEKAEKKDKRNWYLGIVTLIFGSYIAFKELM